MDGNTVPPQASPDGTHTLRATERRLAEVLQMRSATADGVARELTEIERALADLQISLAATRGRFEELEDVVEQCREEVSQTRHAAGLPPAILTSREEKVRLIAARPQELREMLGVRERRNVTRRRRSA